MRRFSVAAAAIIAGASLISGCVSQAGSLSKTEEDAKAGVTRDLQGQGFSLDSVGPFAHTAPSADSPVAAVNVRIRIEGPVECFAHVMAVPDWNNNVWHAVDTLKGLDSPAMTPEDAVMKYHCDGG